MPNVTTMNSLPTIAIANCTILACSGEKGHTCRNALSFGNSLSAFSVVALATVSTSSPLMRAMTSQLKAIFFGSFLSSRFGAGEGKKGQKNEELQLAWHFWY